MARSLRILLSTNSTATTTSSPTPAKKSTAAQPSQYVTVQSDYVIILAALLCALICVVGLIAVARCAWLRRRSPEQRSANKGLKKKILQSLPKRTFDSSTTGAGNGGAAASDCAICLAEYDDGDEIRVLPHCGHVFHVHCIDTWLGSQSSCPSCRQILVVARCQKCGEFPTAKVSGGKHPAGETQVKASTQDRAAAAAVASSLSSDFLP